MHAYKGAYIQSIKKKERKIKRYSLTAHAKERKRTDEEKKKGKKENEQNMRKSYNMSCIHLINMMTTIINIIVLL